MLKVVFDEREEFFSYIRWLVEYFCINKEDLARITEFVENITEEYHDFYAE